MFQKFWKVEEPLPPAVLRRLVIKAGPLAFPCLYENDVSEIGLRTGEKEMMML